MNAVTVIQPSQINGDLAQVFTVSVHPPLAGSLTCHLPDGSTRPAIAGDVYSVQPDGSLQAREAGTAGWWELAMHDNGRIIYAPLGVDGPSYCPFVYVTRVPNAP